MTILGDYGPQIRRQLSSQGKESQAADDTVGRSSGRSSAYEMDQDNAYLTELLSYSLDRLNKEPALLLEDQDCVRRQMQDCAATHYRAFIKAADCLSAVRQNLSSVNTHLKGMLETLPPLEESCSSFSERASALVEKRERQKQLQANYGQLLELLEIPQLMDTCVRNSNYDEALDLEAFVAKMAFLHPEIRVVQSLHAEVKAISSNMQQLLLKRLSGSIQLPECLRVIGFLRRLAVFSESELRLQFLQCREQWMAELVAELDNGNPYDYLKRLTDIHRLHLFDVVMQYKAIFSDDTTPGEAGSGEAQILSSWAHHRICLYLKALDMHLPRIKEGGSLSSVLEHSMYCGMSLGRVGLDFRGLLPPVFESCVASLFSTALANSLDSFHLALERHKWMPMPSIPYGAKRSGTSKSDGGESLESGRDTTADSAEDLSPPQVLMEHMPLAVFVNGLLQAFNELRHCTPLSLGSAVAQTLQDALLAVSTAMSHFHATRGLAESEAPIFESACRVLAEVVAPYVVSCCARLYPGGSVSINIAEATEPLKEIIAAAKARDSFAEANAAPATSAGKLKKTKSVKTAKAVAKQPSAVAKAPKEVEAQNETSTLDAKPPKQVPQ